MIEAGRSHLISLWLIAGACDMIRKVGRNHLIPPRLIADTRKRGGPRPLNSSQSIIWENMMHCQHAGALITRNFRKRWRCKGLRWRHLLRIETKEHQWRMEERTQEFKILNFSPQKMWGWQRSALQEVLAPELRSYVQVGSQGSNRYKLSSIRAPQGARAYPWILSKYFPCVRPCVRLSPYR